MLDFFDRKVNILSELIDIRHKIIAYDLK